MENRNFSPQKMFESRAAAHTPLHTFTGRSIDEFTSWKEETKPAVLATLGAAPPTIDPQPELIAEWRHDGLIKQRWILYVEPDLSATIIIARIGSAAPGEPAPAILCWHGHGEHGKESVMGNDTSPERRDEIDRFNYAYGHKMAKKGFVTFAIDWLGKGDHSEERKPNWNNMAQGRDWCNLYYLHATMLGMTPLSINLAHGRIATDFVSSLDYVDSENLGVMGLSGGGTMTLWTALTDARFKAVEIICYSAYFPVFGFRDINYCGMQITPRLFSLVHLHDLQGLLAPKPLLIGIGANDSCFPVEESMQCFHSLESIYEAAGARKALELELHQGEHGWGGNLSESFFRRSLGKHK